MMMMSPGRGASDNRVDGPFADLLGKFPWQVPLFPCLGKFLWQVPLFPCSPGKFPVFPWQVPLAPLAGSLALPARGAIPKPGAGYDGASAVTIISVGSPLQDTRSSFMARVAAT